MPNAATCPGAAAAGAKRSECHKKLPPREASALERQRQLGGPAAVERDDLPGEKTRLVPG